MILFVGTSTAFPSLISIQETCGSDTIICPIKVLPSNNRMIFCLMEVGGLPGGVCSREGVICGVAEETTRARTTLFPRHAGQTNVPVPLQILHKTVALPPHVGHLPIFSGVPFRISIALVQACHPLLPVYFCQSSLGSWPGRSRGVPISPRKASHIFQDNRLVRFCTSKLCILLRLFPHTLGILQEVLPKRQRLGVYQAHCLQGFRQNCGQNTNKRLRPSHRRPRDKQMISRSRNRCHREETEAR